MRILIRFMRPYRGRIAAMLALLMLQSLGTLFIPTLMAEIVNKGILLGDTARIWRTGAVMLLAAVAVSGVSIAHIYLSSDNAARIGRDLRDSLFERTQALSVGDFSRFGTASMITRATHDVVQLQTAFSTIVELLLPAPFMTVAGLLLAFSKDRLLALVLVGVMALVVVLALLLSRKAIPMFDRLLSLLDELNRTVLEKLAGVRVIRAFHRVEHEKRRMDNAFLAYGRMGIRINRLFAVLMPLITLVMNLCTLLIIAVGHVRIGAGHMQLGDLYAIMEYATMTLAFLIMGLSAIVAIPRMNISARRIAEILEAQSAIVDGTEEVDPDKEISVHNVSFGYQQAEQPVLSGISFTLKRGTTTAIIGSTGAGKSTILRLLMRFYDPQAGQIFYGGQDIRQLCAEDYRLSIGYVPQKAFLFSGTIADNLRHGNPNATDEDMRRALRVAQLDGFVSSLPAGINSPVSQGGANLSGGQRQRLAIARAVIRRPSLYVFDDSFSALDFQTDAKLRAALKKETQNAAVLIVAQRVSTIMDAHQILVLDEGRIIGRGAHRELLEHCPAYRQIAQSQMKEAENA